jgi:putative endonuclease
VDWLVYILRCADGSLYTGITRDLERRVREHNHDNRRGAAYTRGRRPVEAVYREDGLTRSQATRREITIRKLTRKEKERLVAGR